MQLSLIVIRCKDIEKSKVFYERLGLSFTHEQHGSGPAHYAATIDHTVFELYPRKPGEAFDNVRLGFKVDDLELVIQSLDIIDKREFDGEVVYVVEDPDGRRVEVSQ